MLLTSADMHIMCIPATCKVKGLSVWAAPDEIQVSRDLLLPLSAAAGDVLGWKAASHDMSFLFSCFFIQEWTSGGFLFLILFITLLGTGWFALRRVPSGGHDMWQGSQQLCVLLHAQYYINNLCNVSMPSAPPPSTNEGIANSRRRHVILYPPFRQKELLCVEHCVFHTTMVDDFSCGLLGDMICNEKVSDIVRHDLFSCQLLGDMIHNEKVSDVGMIRTDWVFA